MDVHLRPARIEDVDALHRVHRRAEVGDGLPLVTPRAQVAAWADDPHFSFPDDARIAQLGAEVVGYARTWYQPSDASRADVYLSGAVDPAWRGRGAGRALLAWQLARGRELLRTAPPHLPRFVHTQVYDVERAAIAMYERAGLALVRWFHELLCPLADVAPAAAPPGITIAPWSPARAEELRLLSNQTFADAWGTSPVDARAWAHRLGEHGTRVDLSWMALAGDRLVGFSLDAHYPGDEPVTGRRDGWIQSLGVDREARGRGVASALIAAACAGFRAAGFTHAALGVDTDSPTGAQRLYHRLGFRLMHRRVQHELEVTARQGAAAVARGPADDGD